MYLRQIKTVLFLNQYGESEKSNFGGDYHSKQKDMVYVWKKWWVQGAHQWQLVRFDTSDVEPKYEESLSNIRPLSLRHLTADFAHAVKKTMLLLSPDINFCRYLLNRHLNASSLHSCYGNKNWRYIAGRIKELTRLLFYYDMICH